MSHLDSHVMYRSVEGGVMLLAEAAHFSVKILSRNSLFTLCQFQSGEAQAEGPERTLHTTLGDEAFLPPVLRCCEVEGDARSVEACRGPFYDRNAPVRYEPAGQQKCRKERGADRQIRLITSVENSVILSR